MRVIATAKGYDGTVVREEGEEFDVPEGAKASWFAPVEDTSVAEAARGGAKGAKGAKEPKPSEQPIA